MGAGGAVLAALLGGIMAPGMDGGAADADTLPLSFITST